MTLLSIHIPETVGSVFGELLQQHFGGRMCLHYYHPYRNFLQLADVPADIECLHGHFLARRFFERFPDRRLVTWLRHPVWRVVSEYYKLRRQPDPQSALSQLVSAGADLLAFSEHKFARNTQARYLDGVPLSQFAFVGVGDRWAEELARFNRTLGIDLPTGANPEALVMPDGEVVTEAVRHRILELNREDCELYEASGGSLSFEAVGGAPAAAGAPHRRDTPPTAHSSPEASYFERYTAQVARLQNTISGDAALEAAVGGDFLTVGKLEFALLRQLGLKGSEMVVDVGCGSGRLALPLSALPGVSYLGTDLVPELLAHARNITARGDWRFEPTSGLTIPCQNETADFVCFFSVLTHLTHEDSYRYLREARRVLKPGGRIVFSFLEFYIPWHWSVFERAVNNVQPGEPLSQFIERDAIKAWAGHLALKLVSFYDGDKPHIRKRPVGDLVARSGDCL